MDQHITGKETLVLKLVTHTLIAEKKTFEGDYLLITEVDWVANTVKKAC